MDVNSLSPAPCALRMLGLSAFLCSQIGTSRVGESLPEGHSLSYFLCFISTQLSVIFGTNRRINIVFFLFSFILS